MTDRTDGERPDHSSETTSRNSPSETTSRNSPSETTSRNSPSGGNGDPADTTPPTDPEDRPDGVVGWVRWFWTADTGSLVYLRDVLTSVLIVGAIGALLFAASGVWPPMVAVESGSMEPNMERGDLVFIADNDRFVPDGAIEEDGRTTGIVPADVAEQRSRTKFGGHGDVVVFMPNGNTGQTPIIHRAMFWVETGENWHDRANTEAIGGAADCEELNHCPAPHAGFITKGDNELTNANYDQVSRLSAPVRPEWVVGTAELRVPYLGHVRLLFSGVTATPLDGVSAADHDGTSDIETTAANGASKTDADRAT